MTVDQERHRMGHGKWTTCSNIGLADKILCDERQDSRLWRSGIEAGGEKAAPIDFLLCRFVARVEIHMTFTLVRVYGVGDFPLQDRRMNAIGVICLRIQFLPTECPEILQTPGPLFRHG